MPESFTLTLSATVLTQLPGCLNVIQVPLDIYIYGQNHLFTYELSGFHNSPQRCPFSYIVNNDTTP